MGSQGAASPSSDELLRMLVESATDYAIFSTDPSGKVTSWNKGAEHVLGQTEDEILGQAADVIFTPEDRKAGAPEHERRQALAYGRAEDERWQLRKDGSRFWASGLMMPLAERGLGFVKILRDRTEQHRIESQLRENEERFRLLATNIPQLVFRSRPDGMRTWGSPQWIDFTGLSLPKSLGFGWLAAIHPDDLEGTIEGWRGAQASGEYYVEHRVRRDVDGEYRWHQTRARPIESEPGNGDADWVGTMTDIHDIRDLQNRQQVLMGELQHRTRNLLAVVQAIASQTLRTSDSLSDFGREFESRLHALSRVQSLLARADQTDIELSELAHAEVRAHLDRAAETDKVQVEGPPVSLPATAAQVLVLALHELATNAVKYGALAQPSGKVFLTWRLAPKGSGCLLLLDWKESGVVMPEDGGPKRRGYGSLLIERALRYQLGAETALEFEPDGVHCSIALSLEMGKSGSSHG